MAIYHCYLESGPRRRKTMVHVLDLLGCVAVGPTTEDALAATPAAVKAYRRFLARHGEPLGDDAPVELEVVEHVTEGQFLGSGSPSILFFPDREPIGDADLEVLLNRFRGLTDELATWVAAQDAAQLDAAPEGGGRTARAVVLHVIEPVGAYLSAALGGAPGVARVATLAARGELDLATGLREAGALAEARIRATTPEERSLVRQRAHDQRTLRKALRRMLEHHWEHLAELARRPGGPTL